jgi:hypothetical protein
MKSEYLSCPWNTSLGDWYKKWFYIQEEPNTATLCDVGYILEKRVSWNEKSEYARQVRELMELLPWTHLDRLAIAGSFVSRRVQPCQKRVHAIYEYQGSADQTKMRPNRLHDDEIKRRIADLFSLTYLSYHPLSVIVHAYKLIRPAPKVFQAHVFLLCRSHS